MIMTMTMTHDQYLQRMWEDNPIDCDIDVHGRTILLTENFGMSRYQWLDRVWRSVKHFMGKS